MKKRKLRILAVLTTALLYVFMISAYAYSLNDGSVRGLPEKLVVLDDEGHSVSENGSYYFSVTDMEPKVTYVKNIQIMNLREDKSYNIYFRAESVSSKGKIDLENECECVITLDEKEIYRGKVSGKGKPDMQKTPLDLGKYAPNEYRYMKVSITWDGTSSGDFIDNGERVVTASGTQVVRGKSGETYINGETEFKWLFSAEVEKEDESSSISTSSSSTAVSSEVSSKSETSKETSSKEINSKEMSSKEMSSKEVSSKEISSAVQTSSSKEISSNTSSNTSSNSSTNIPTSSRESSSQASKAENSSKATTSSGDETSKSNDNVSKTSQSTVSEKTVSDGRIITNDSSKTSSTVTIESFIQTGEAVAVFAIVCILIASLALIVLTIQRKQREE